jgi:short subunit dehydrogenase-like uncharacterized protein
MTDVVLFGATGFVGKLTAAYLATQGHHVGLAGRSKDKLEAVRRDLGPATADWPLIVADCSDVASVKALASSAKAVATTVGPYAKYGLPLLEACARAGTHYADLTGEVLFHREAIDRFHDVAVAEQVRADGQGELGETVLVASLKGGVSGGTVDSLRTQVDAVKADPSLAALIADTQSLSPGAPPEQPDGFSVSQHDGTWTGPFVMAPYNTRVVRRSNALAGWSSGLRYTERMAFGRGLPARLLATAAAGSLRFSEPAMGFGPSRFVLDALLPKPGKGPGERVRANGWFRMEVDTLTSTGARYRAVVSAKGDPGYAATAVMLAESALCLAGDVLASGGGLLTPATAMGVTLADRLRKAGFTLEVTRC